jgi:uncharacterized membrane protein YkoI
MLCTAAMMFSVSALSRPAAISASDTVAVPYAPISLDAAVAAAEKYVHGNAVYADYQKRKDGLWAYEIEVRSGARIFEVIVDAEKGTVIASTEGKADADDRDDGAAD